jgi:hypothetical protein
MTPIEEYNRAVAGNLNVWVPGAGGTEPVSTIDGVRYQWMFNPCLREHAYYCLDTDLFPAREELPACLAS